MLHAMGTKKVATTEDHREEPLRELKPWREVGWIFNDGGAVVIERQNDEIRMRNVEL
jgi:hypothetical protein